MVVQDQLNKKGGLGFLRASRSLFDLITLGIAPKRTNWEFKAPMRGSEICSSPQLARLARITICPKVGVQELGIQFVGNCGATCILVSLLRRSTMTG